MGIECLDVLQSECVEERKKLERRREELQGARRELVVGVQTTVFPVQIDPLSEDDAGEQGVRERESGIYLTHY